MKRVVLALLAACGGSSDRPDALPLDAIESSGSVTVIVTERGKPVSGLPVFFHDATGQTVFEAATSLAGSSGFDVPGGAVTVLLPKLRFGIDRLSTFTAVQNGDVLQLDLEPLGPRSVEVSVRIDAGPAVLYTSCGGDEPFGLVAGETTKVTLECTGSKVDLLAVTVDPETNAPVGSQYRANVEPGTIVDFGSTVTPIPNVAVSYTNPNAFDFISTTQAIIGPNGRLFDAVLGATMGSAEPFVIAQPDAPGSSLLLASHGYPRPNELDEQVLYTTQAIGSPLAVDLTTRLPQYADTARFAGGKLAWTEQANGTQAADFVRARVRFHRDDIPEGVAWTWEIVAPRGTKSEIQFPTLRAKSALTPIDTDTSAIEELTNVKLPGGYNRVRANGFADVTTFGPTTIGGTMIVQRSYRHEPVE